MKNIKILALALLLALAFLPKTSNATQIWMGGFVSCTINSGGSMYTITIVCGRDPNTECSSQDGSNVYVNGPCVWGGIVYHNFSNAALVSDNKDPRGEMIVFDTPAL